MDESESLSLSLSLRASSSIVRSVWWSVFFSDAIVVEVWDGCCGVVVFS